MPGIPPQIGDVAVIAYLPGDLAIYLRGLTERLAPKSPHPRPHLTLLPPRTTPPSLDGMLAQLTVAAREEPPFRIRMGELATFLPISEVLYLELLHGEKDARRLHQRLQRVFPPDRTRERFRFHPHVTLAYALPAAEITQLLPDFHDHWLNYRGPRDVVLRELTLVQQTAPRQWDDIGSAPLCGHR